MRGGRDGSESREEEREDDDVECDVDEWRAVLGDCEKGRGEAMRGRSEPEAGHGGEDGEEEGSPECGDAAV